MTLGARVGLSAEQLQHMNDWRTHPGFSARERVVLEYAEFMHRSVKLTDELYARLRAELSEKELMELAITVGLGHLINRFHGTFQTRLDELPGDFSQ